MRDFVSLLRATFTNYTHHAAFFAAIMTAPFVCSLIVHFLLQHDLLWYAGVSSLGFFVVQIFAMVALILAVCGETDTLSASYRAAAKYFWRYVLYSTAVFFLSIVAFLVGGILGFLLGLPFTFLTENEVFVAWLTAFPIILAGAAALIYISVRLVFGQLILVLEESGPIESIKAAWYTVNGRWWQVFWNLFFFFSGVFALSFVVGVLVSFASEFPMAVTGVSFDHELILHTITTGLNALVVTPLTICFIYELYRGLRTHTTEHTA